MSLVPRAVARTAATDGEAGPVSFASGSMIAATTFPSGDAEYVPIGKRSAVELSTNAQELRSMASTATTPDIVKALLTLADRYSVLAERRRKGEKA